MKYRKGEELTETQKKEVLARYVHRFTGEHKPYWANKPMPNGDSYKPTHETDLEWIHDHSFAVKSDGSFDQRVNSCMPACMAD